MVFEKVSAYTLLSPYFQERVRLDEPLAHHSSFGVGGFADLWLSIQTQQELSELISLCTRQRWPLLVVGNGTNILYADAGVRGIVAQVAMHDYSIEELSPETALVIAEAGVQWTQLLKELVPSGWGGLEFGIGIPGTLGAGVISNVGAHNQELGQVLEWIEVLDAQGCNRETPEPPEFPVVVLRRYPQESLDLGYRHSRFREQRLAYIDPHGQLVFPQRKLIEPDELVVSLALRVHRQDKALLAALLEQHIQERKQSDHGQRPCGSIFKNPPGTTAGQLIAQAGLSGMKQGDAQISERNANFIVNLGGANATEISALIKEAHQRVLSQYGVHLALNVELIGEW